jgi:hypothetical protein
LEPSDGHYPLDQRFARQSRGGTNQREFEESALGRAEPTSLSGCRCRTLQAHLIEMTEDDKATRRAGLAIQPFGPGTESVRIMDMTGRQLEAALKHYRSSNIWGHFLRVVLREFRMAGGMPTDRVASRVNLTPDGLLTLARETPPPH